MSEYTESIVPYEFLVRWDANGNLAAAHVGFRKVGQLDGVIVSGVPMPVQSVALGLADGFPLSDILDQIQIDALARIAVLEAGGAQPAVASTTENSISIPRWKGRAYLAGLPPTATGTFSGIPGDTLLDQIDAFAESALTPTQYERYLGADPWHRTDVMIAQMQALLGLSDADVDAWFAAAGAFV